MPQYLTGQEINTWGFSKKLLNEDNVSALLVKLAIYRQASKLDETTLELFTQYLVNLDLRAFQVAMKVLSTSERQEGETAFPSLGSILAAMEEARERFPVFSKGAKEVDTTPVFADSKQRKLQA